MRDLIRSGLQLPLFTYPDVPPEGLFPRVIDQAHAAEEAGYESVWVMDHFWQLPILGPPELEMLEGYTTLGAIAQATRSVRVGTLVTGITYRNPALLAKEVTTLDVISGGRAVCGVGTAWYQEEHEGLGFDFPPLRTRFAMLEEALGIITAMFRGERPTVDGEFYRVADAINSPLPLQQGGPPVLIGGQGERRTIPLAARWANALNLIAGGEELEHKVQVTTAALADAGRTRDDLNITWLCSLVIGDSDDDAQVRFDDLLAQRGFDPGSIDDATRALLTSRILVGDEDRVASLLRQRLDAGLDGVIHNLPADGGDPDAVRRAARVVQAALGS